jgi:hypothetical protein
MPEYPLLSPVHHVDSKEFLAWPLLACPHLYSLPIGFLEGGLAHQLGAL